MTRSSLRLNTTGDRVRSLRRARGLTLAALAALARVGVSTLSEIERGVIARPAAGTMERIGAALDVSAHYLHTGRESIDDAGAPGAVARLFAQMPPEVRASWVANGREMLRLWVRATRRKPE